MNKRIWMPQSRLPDNIDRSTIADVVRFPNQDDVTQQLGRGCGEQPTMCRDVWPTVEPLEIEIDVPELALDFWRLPLGLLVSARLREAWAPASGAVEYIAVNAGGSCTAASDKDYRLTHILAEEAVIDLDKSDYETADHLDWLPKGFPFYAKSFVIRADAKPVTPLFRDACARNQIFCTDIMAVRALLAGCTGVRFVDPETLRLLQPIRYRTLEGIAESGDYDSETQKELSHLVENIPAIG